MFKAIVSYILILLGLAILGISTSHSLMQKIFAARDNDKWWGTYPCLHGDLVSMSYLDFVGVLKPPPIIPLKRPVYDGPANVALYLHADSYCFHISDTVFAALADFHLIDRNHGMNYHLDPVKKNILVIEISERYIRQYFGGLQMLDEVCDSLVKKKSISAAFATRGHSRAYASILTDFSINDLFNKYINQNLQCNLFNYNIIIPMFEYKAALNYYVFNRASGDVVISDDRKSLFLKETVSKTGAASSYSPVSGAELTRLVDNFNTISAHYKASGFAEVYLSMIPNAATIMQPAPYNNLIPLIQNDPRLKMSIIDAYSTFKVSSQTIYLPGDTHWNNTGRQLWLDMVNAKLTNQ